MTAPTDLPPPPGALSATSPAPAAAPPAGGLNVGAIIKRMLAHLPVALIVFGLGVSITTVMSRSRKPTFSSETVIYYREGIGRQYLGVENEGDQLKALPARLKETLLSRAYLEKIIKEFNLYPQIVALEGYIPAVDRFRSKIGFKARSLETFQISFEGATAEEAQEVAARLADVLIEDMAERKKARAKTATEFLEAEKKRADEDLEKRETDLATFIAGHPEFAAENNAELAGSGVRTEKLKATADPALLALDRQQQRLRAAIAQKQGGGGQGAPAAGGGAVGPDPGLAAAKAAADAELAAAQKDLSDKSDKLTDAHPDVKAAKARVQVAMEKQREAMGRIIASSPPPVPPAAAGGSDDDPYETKPADERARLEREMAKNEREMQLRKKGIKPDAAASAFANQVIELEKEWKQLNRERDKARQRQNSIDDRLFKAEANAASELGGYSAQVMVLDPAFLPTEPGNMGKSKFITIGVVVSLLAGLVLAAAWGMLLDDRVFVAEDLEAFAPVLAKVPRGPVQKGKRRG